MQRKFRTTPSSLNLCFLKKRVCRFSEIYIFGKLGPLIKKRPTEQIRQIFENRAFFPFDKTLDPALAKKSSLRFCADSLFQGKYNFKLSFPPIY